MSVDETWTVPGVPRPRPSASGPTTDLAALQQALDAVLAVRPGLLSPEAALARAAGLLVVLERLQAASLQAVADVDARDLHLLAGAGSARTWLRAQPAGDTGQLASARLLADRPLLRAALAAGTVSVRSACTAARALERVPARVPDEELRAVLVDGVGQVLAVWAGSACSEPTPVQEADFDARRERLVAAVRAGLTGTWGGPAERLEPAFALLAEALTPAELPGAVGLLVDALQPEAAEDAADDDYRSRELVLRKLAGGGWSLRAHLTDEVGQQLHQALTARERPPATPTDAEAATTEATDQEPEPEDAYGTAGAGVPVQLTGSAVEGAPLVSTGQRGHDALAALLADLGSLPPALVGSGAPAPVGLVLTAGVDALGGQPGAPPPQLQTRGGPVPLTRSALQRLGCGASVAAVLLDAARRPVGASGEHRHATARDRRAMHAAWGHTCGVNACGSRGTIPHHADPWWRSGVTRHADLVPLCDHHHHDVHDGGKTLRLRDGRTLDAWGWC